MRDAWEEFKDEETGKLYYYNHISQKRQDEKPLMVQSHLLSISSPKGLIHFTVPRTWPCPWARSPNNSEERSYRPQPLPPAWVLGQRLVFGWCFVSASISDFFSQVYWVVFGGVIFAASCQLVYEKYIKKEEKPKEKKKKRRKQQKQAAEQKEKSDWLKDQMYCRLSLPQTLDWQQRQTSSMPAVCCWADGGSGQPRWRE